MPLRTARQDQRRTILRLIALFMVVIAVAGAVFAIALLYIGSHAPPVVTSSALRIITVANGEHIGMSDGNYVFDTTSGLFDVKLKVQASNALNQGNVSEATLLWKQAIVADSRDAETHIYLEDQQACAPNKAHVTLVVGTMLTGDTSELSSGHDNLQGAYVAQKEYNDGFKLGNIQVCLVIANAGSQAKYSTLVAQQIVQAAKQDKHIVGVMGWPYSSYTLNAVDILSKAHIPMVSPTASTDSLTGKSSFFFRVAPPNKSQAIVGAKYAEQQLQTSRAALFVDPKDAYSNSLADHFSRQFISDGNQIVVTEQYTVGKKENLPALLQHALAAQPDLIYFAGYSADMSVLLADLPASRPEVRLMGGDALYQLGGYTSSARAGFERLNFSAFAYPDEWGYLKLKNQEPAFFTIYAYDFDPSGSRAGVYGYSRADNDVILSYDATFALLQGCKNAIRGGTTLTSDALRQGLAMITGSNAIQGVGGQISFGSDGDPIHKAIVILTIDPDGHIKLSPRGGVQGCFLLGACSNP